MSPNDQTTVPVHRTPEIGEDVPVADVRPALNQIVGNYIRPVAWGLTVLYLIFGIAHLLLLPEDVRVIMALVAFSTAIVLNVIGYFCRRDTVRPQYAHPIAAGIAVLILVNSLLHLYLIPEPRLTTNVTLLTIGVGIFFLSVPWLAFILALAMGGWLIVAQPTLADPEWVHFAFAQIAAVFIAAMAHTVRYRATRRIERLRIQDKRRRQSLRRAAEEAQQRTIELEQAKEAAESASRAKTAFLTKISHEFRTPLSVIIGYSEMLQEKQPATNVFEMEAIQTAAHSLLKMVNGLIDLASIEAGRLTISPATFQLDGFIDDIVLEAQPLVRANRNELRVHRADNLGQMVSDASKIRRVLLDLIDNAAKFTQDGEVTLSVMRQTADNGQGDWVQLRISDTGIGIAPEQMEHLFEIFRQGDDSSTRRHGGVGMGLALAERYCNLLGGTIHVENLPEQGALIVVRLPAMIDEATPATTLTAPAGEREP